MIAVVDYGVGNLRSVMNALEAISAKAQIVTAPGGLRGADAVILPGVGAFGDAMRMLRERDLVAVLGDVVMGDETPFLGLCVGMQLLAKSSDEQGRHEGLGWIDAVVERIPAQVRDVPLRVPHTGWNEVAFTRKDGMYAGLGGADSFYFVHSYRVVPGTREVVSGECEYGEPFTASIQWRHVWGTQYHPEKSHRAGLTVLRNFVQSI